MMALAAGGFHAGAETGHTAGFGAAEANFNLHVRILPMVRESESRMTNRPACGTCIFTVAHQQSWLTAKPFLADGWRML